MQKATKDVINMIKNDLQVSFFTPLHCEAAAQPWLSFQSILFSCLNLFVIKFLVCFRWFLQSSTFYNEKLFSNFELSSFGATKALKTLRRPFACNLRQQAT